MTVKELRQKLAGMDDNEHVVVTLEDDSGLQCFEVVEVSSHRGTTVRTDGGDAGYRFEARGPLKWTFIEIEKA